MAYQGIDSRDLYRPGSGMSLRRLLVLLKALPPEAPLWAEIRAAEEQANKAAPDLIRERQQAWHDRNEQARAKEAG